jgi:diacylglycerol kinase family enzyme
MYYYVYDTFLNDKKYEKVIDRIKTRLLDLEIQGKHEKLTLLKSLDELINDEAKRGINTVVVLGNDKTFLKVVDVIAKNDLTLGLIPVGPGNSLAESLGLPMEDEACEIIAARKVVNFDLGKVANQYFFSNLSIDKNLDRLNIEKDNYKVVPQKHCAVIEVSNFYYPETKENFSKKMKKYSAQDGKLELVIKMNNASKGWLRKKSAGHTIDTIIQSDEFKIKSFEYLPVKLDGYRIIKTPIEVGVEKDKFKVIVGKTRLKNIN